MRARPPYPPQLLFWDERAGSAPVTKVSQAHGAKDVQCVDWSAMDPHCVATGGEGEGPALLFM